MDFLIISPEILDKGNSVFEMLGGLVVATSCRETYRNKFVSGVTIWYVLFFVIWGFWNIPYYLNLEQPMSLLGAFGVCAINLVWLMQVIYYKLIKKGRGNDQKCRLCGAGP